MRPNRTVYVCRGTGCVSGGGDIVFEALGAEVAKQRVKDAEVDFTGCHGFCQQGPNVVIEPDEIFYTHVEPEDAGEIVMSHLRKGEPVKPFIRNRSVLSCATVVTLTQRRLMIISPVGDTSPCARPFLI